MCMYLKVLLKLVCVRGTYYQSKTSTVNIISDVNTTCDVLTQGQTFHYSYQINKIIFPLFKFIMETFQEGLSKII